MKHVLFISLICTMLACSASAQQASVLPNQHEVKYVIFMVPDGMGLADVTAARIQKNGVGGSPLYLETLEHIGYQRSYSKENTITDSAAAASAWACGEKFVNDEICFHADGAPHNRSLLELAKLKGMGTGLVATQTITHATPAAFGSHVFFRDCEQEIARQYVEVTQPDVMLGGGRSKFISTVADPCGTAGNFVTEATSLGYAYVTTAAGLETAVQSKQAKVLGLFAGSFLLPEIQRPPGTTQPRLPDMTSAALSILEEHAVGFFVVIEGSHIDSCNHLENFPCQYGEVAAFDESVKRVLDWVATSPERREHTLLIVAVDHETGGFAIKGTEAPGGEPLGYFDVGWTFPANDVHHTGGDVMIWSQGPGSEALAHGIDNTFVYQVVKDALKF